MSVAAALVFGAICLVSGAAIGWAALALKVERCLIAMWDAIAEEHRTKGPARAQTKRVEEIVQRHTDRFLP